MKRFLSPPFLALAAICFFLPFVSVSCNTSALQEGLAGLGGEDAPMAGPSPIPELPTGEGGEVELVRATGWDIVIGARPEPSEQLSQLEGAGNLGQQAPMQAESFPGRIYAILAFAVAILGIALTFLPARLGAIAGIAAGVLGVIFLFFLRTSINGEFSQAALLGFSVNYEVGWWLSLVAFLLAAAAAAWALMDIGRPVAYREPPPGAPPGREPPPAETPPGGAPPPPAPPEPPPPA